MQPNGAEPVHEPAGPGMPYLNVILQRVQDGSTRGSLLGRVRKKVARVPEEERDELLRIWSNELLRHVQRLTLPMRSRYGSNLLQVIGTYLEFDEDHWRQLRLIPWYQPANPTTPTIPRRRYMARMEIDDESQTEEEEEDEPRPKKVRTIPPWTVACMAIEGVPADELEIACWTLREGEDQDGEEELQGVKAFMYHRYPDNRGTAQVDGFWSHGIDLNELELVRPTTREAAFKEIREHLETFDRVIIVSVAEDMNSDIARLTRSWGFLYLCTSLPVWDYRITLPPYRASVKARQSGTVTLHNAFCPYRQLHSAKVDGRNETTLHGASCALANVMELGRYIDESNNYKLIIRIAERWFQERQAGL